MKKRWMIPAVFAGLTIASCGGSETTEESGTSDSTGTTETTAQVEASLDNPFPEIPAEDLGANSGDYVFAAFNHALDMYKGSKFEEVPGDFVGGTLIEPGNPKSKVKYVSEAEVINYFIVPVKPGATAQVGDIVVAPWVHGGSMTRAIVTDASDPTKPMVNFIDIDWDNPATNSEGVGFGKEVAQLEANSFFVLNSTWQTGSTVAVNNNGTWEQHTLIKVIGDKVIALDWSSKFHVHDKANCKSIEVKGDFKVGDKVQGPKYGSYKELTISKIDAKFGRVYCKDEYDKEVILPMGTITKSL